MKIKQSFQIALLSLAAPALYAAEHSVSNSAEFQSAWTIVVAGDTITLKGDVDLGSLPELADKTGSIKINSAEGQKFSIVWNAGTNNAPLPDSIELNNVQIVGAAAGLYEGTKPIVIGSGNLFTNNNGTVAQVLLGASVGENNEFSNNAGGVFYVGDATELSITSGNNFTDNSSTGLGGAIHLADNAAAGTDYQLNLNAASADISFSGNIDSMAGNDIYMGVNTRASMAAAEGKTISLGSGLASADETAFINKTGSGNLYVSDASRYSGALLIAEGSTTLADDSIYGTGMKQADITVAGKASLVLGKNTFVNARVVMNAGSNMLVMADDPSAQWTTLSQGMHLTGDATVSFSITDATQKDSSGNALLSFTSPNAITRSSEAHSLTTNLDFRLSTGIKPDGVILPYQDWSTLDATSQEILKEASLTITDRTGTKTVSATAIDANTGEIDLSKILAEINFDRPGESVANAAWSSSRALDALYTGAISSQMTHMPAGRSAFWAAGFGTSSSADSEGTQSGYSSSGGGYAIGYNYAASAELLMGISFGQWFGSNEGDGGINSDATATTDQLSLMGGIYANWRISEKGQQGNGDYRALYWSSYFGFGNTENEWEGSGRSGSWSDSNFALYSHLSYEMELSKEISIRPYIGLELLNTSQGSFSTGGANSLHFEGDSLVNLRLPIGIAISRSFETSGGGRLIPSLRIAYYANLMQDTPEVGVRDSYGNSWTSQAADPGRSGIHLRAAIDWQANENWATSFSYTLDATSGDANNTFSAAVRYSF